MAIDFQSMTDSIEAATCIIAVEVRDDGSCGGLRIVTGNKAYIDSIEHPQGDYSMKKSTFVPNSLYTDYLPRDLNFEDFCLRSAVQKKCLHSYVKPNQMPIWFNMTFIPAGSAEENIHYCMYSMEVNFTADTKTMSNVSQELASDVLETCIKLRGTTDFLKTMHEVVSDIRNMCKAEHCCILRLDDYEKKCSILCEDFAPDTKLTPRNEDMSGFYEIAKSWKDLIGSSNCIIAKDDHDMELVKERNPVWYESLRYAHAKSIVLFPLKSHDEFLGYMWAINFDEAQTSKIRDTLELTTFILGSEIGNYLLLDRLKVLSAKDMLTGVLNRNEMNNRVDALSEDNKANRQSVGVVFADLNGLKTVNDEFGHEAGDALLKDAAKAMFEVFPKDSIYRAGGDEFTVIMLGVTEDELKAKVQELRKATNKYDRVVFAIGACIEDDYKNTRRALKIADGRMYEDKRIFYENHPELKKRL
jgi:diguanylate cyclase (GGDEF)-like protein